MIKKHIPNTITTLNLLSGSIAVITAYEGDYKATVLLVLLAALFDFLDGFSARLLKSYSPLGKELDSLADMVSFGVLPGAMVFSLLSKTGLSEWLPYLAFIIPVFSGLRLAKFNIDTRQTVDFIGLNTPSGAIFVLGFYMQYFTDWQFRTNWDFAIYAKIAAMILPFILAFLMVAEFRMFSLKGNPFDWKQNKFRVLLLLSAIPQLIFLKWLGLSTVILSYVVFAFLHNTFERKKI